MRCLIWLSLLVFVYAPAASQKIDIYHTNITQNSVWDADTVRIFNNLTVDPNINLTIKPGVVVEFQGLYKLTVFGSLVAKGSKADSIHFVPLSNQQGWQGIQIDAYYYSNTQDSSVFDYCVLRNGRSDYSWSYAGSALGVFSQRRVRIQHSNIRNNIGQNYSAPIYLSSSNVIIKDCTIAGNSGSMSGGIYAYSCTPHIERNQIIRNRSQASGGGITVEYGTARIIGNFIANNIAGSYGGGIMLSSSTAGMVNENTLVHNEAYSGGGLYTQHDGTLVMEKNTIAYNKTTGSGGGLNIQYNSGFIIRNSIIYFNTASGVNSEITLFNNSSQATRVISYCNIRNGLNGINSTTWYPYEGTYENNMDVNPFFRDAANNDFRLNWTNYPIVDATMSPCIDAGDPMNLHDPDGSVIEMGSYYFPQEERNFPPRGDFDADRRNGYKNLLVNFTTYVDPGDSEVVSYLWDFGDGSTSTEESPSHEYVGIGHFNVSLTVTDKNNLSHKLTKTAFIIMHSNHYIEGAISGTFKKDEADYFIGGDAYIPDGEKLVIEPGVKIIFGGWYKLNVHGVLLAQGSATDSIIFTYYDTLKFGSSEPKLGGWGGIIIDGMNMMDSTIIAYSRIEFAKGEYGGGVSIFSNRVRVSNSTIRRNKAPQSGGGILLMQSSAKISDNFIAFNEAGRHHNSWQPGGGGGIHCSGGVPMILRNIIYKNHAFTDGGGLHLQNGTKPSLINNVISTNSAQTGGGIYSYSTQRYNVVNNTIISNTASTGGGAHFYYSTRTDFFNSILHANNPDNVTVWDSNTELGFRNCLVNGGKSSMRLSSPLNIFYYIKCIEGNPNLAPTSEGFGRLLSTSPAIDKGYEDVTNLFLPAVDIIGTPRILNNVIDIGAYEYAPLPAPELLVETINLNGDEDFGTMHIGLDSLFAFDLGNQWLDYNIVRVNEAKTNTNIDNRTVKIESLQDRNGVEEFAITATNGEATIQTSVSINIGAINDPPTMTVPNVYYSTFSGFSPMIVDVSKLFNDVDSDLSTSYKIDHTELSSVSAILDGEFLMVESLPKEVGPNTIVISASDGEFTITQNINVYVSPVLGPEDDPSGDFDAKPNPTKNIVVVKYREQSTALQIIDGAGRLINVPQMKLSETESQLDLTELPSGLYFLHLNDKRNHRVIKLIRN